MSAETVSKDVGSVSGENSEDYKEKIEIHPPLSMAYGIDSWLSPMSPERLRQSCWRIYIVETLF